MEQALPAYTAIEFRNLFAFIRDSITGVYNSDTISVVINSYLLFRLAIPLNVEGKDPHREYCRHLPIFVVDRRYYQIILLLTSGEYILNAVDPVSGCECADTIQITINRFHSGFRFRYHRLCKSYTLMLHTIQIICIPWSNGATDSAITVLQSEVIGSSCRKVLSVVLFLIQ
ncbi:MAG: hypothetical protein IPN13_12580 [Bacteroidetes bacterium]|nr:hypothetical protein [Bacteroidota bacterium]